MATLIQISKNKDILQTSKTNRSYFCYSLRFLLNRLHITSTESQTIPKHDHAKFFSSPHINQVK